MLLSKLKINYFGRFHNKEIDLKPGINLIYGDNEAGKSTIHSFIKGMFFGIDRLRGRGSSSKEDLYARYLPWDYPGAYGGSMDLEIEGKKYRLQRSFHSSDKLFTVIDLSTGREVVLKEGMIRELIPGLTEATFKNTISIEQLKAQTDTELATQVRNYIANLSVAKSKEVNVAKAVSFLTEQRKRLESLQNPDVLNALKSEIEIGVVREEKLEQLTLQMKELLEREKQLRNQKERLSKATDHETSNRMEQLPAILEKYRAYEELHNQLIQMDYQLTELKNKGSEEAKQQHTLSQMRDDKRVGEVLRSELYELERKNMEVTQKLGLAQRRGKRVRYGMSGVAVIAMLITFLTGLQLFGLLLAAGCLMVGGACFIILLRKNNRVISELRNTKATLVKQSADAQNKIMDILTRHQVITLEALADRQEEHLRSSLAIEHAKELQMELEARRSMAQDSMDAIYDTIMTYLQYFIRAEELTAETMQRLTEELRLRKQESLGRQSELNEGYEACRLQIEKLRWEITSMETNEDELLNNQRQYEQLKCKQEENGVELEAIKLALTSIGELSTQIHDNFGCQLNDAVSEVIRKITGQRYNDLKIDEKLDIKVGWNGNYVLLERLSAGTIDQVYFALRLAVADLLLGKDEVPLIFDDSFALYDDNRVKAALNEIANRKQSILFTCHKREQKLLEELQIPYHLVKLS
jgi:uncharacterized protein YhaN